ncbi:MAG: 50S ribosomal protein L25 [Actinobacteria bacterium]|nr:50S ribosomal protein L25 [Actinomycetota bacterium]MSZ95852.1 50S ribosomal protein L25 [Actinomycetota bacterium]
MVIDSLAVSNTATLSAETGRITGSSSSRRLRTEDRIPGILYGQGMQPLVLSVTRRDLRVALSGPAGYNTILNLTVGGQSFNAVVKEMQRHPVRRTVAHIDFMQINLSEEITMHVPLRLTGVAKAVVSAGGLVDPAVDSIEVRTTPSNIPNEILIDITDMTSESVVHLADVKMPAGVTAVGDPDMLIATVLTSRGAATTAAADAPAAAGDAPAAESAS